MVRRRGRKEGIKEGRKEQSRKVVETGMMDNERI